MPSVGKGRKIEMVFCVPQTSLPTSLASVPCERPARSRACLGLRGGGVYVRPAVGLSSSCEVASWSGGRVGLCLLHYT